MAIQLSHTLQTSEGMVIMNGNPQTRRYPDGVADIQSLDLSWKSHMPPKRNQLPHVVTYLQSHLGLVPKPVCDVNDYKLLEYAANLGACRSMVEPDHLRKYMRMRTRLDLEQAAAVVISAFVTAGRIGDAVRLIKETQGILTNSCMWIDPDELFHHALVESQGIENIGRKLQLSAAKRGTHIPPATSIAELIPLLIRVRRSTPNDRCLIIPQWMFDKAQITAPAHIQTVFDAQDHSLYPIAPAASDAIIVSRHHFRVYQHKIFALFQFWKPDINLRHRIKNIADDVLYGSSWIDSRVYALNDVALLSHYFFAFQRRFQKKVVSTSSGTAFLAKGEGSKIYQNNVSQKSTFEEVLLDIAESGNEGVVVAMGADNTLDLIDQTCRLMREYVDVYAAGKKQNLTFKKGKSGGRGRGPVDEYNLLCDVLSYLRKQARDEGILDMPGPVYKFLAKDIMKCNNGWADDAFANGRKPGWEEWLERRQKVEEDDSWDIVVR
ncbi:hypothetical protein DE146DRAFT_627021 [Phaeosphaeria sp. MPI-PUGE-AT-0046c]|nr:hypothetical protein DE146DRAFT_627021 [Phaeosphaeria sp. MPI-PUGE-AT-0046c]